MLIGHVTGKFRNDERMMFSLEFYHSEGKRANQFLRPATAA